MGECQPLSQANPAHPSLSYLVSLQVGPAAGQKSLRIFPKRGFAPRLNQTMPVAVYDQWGVTQSKFSVARPSLCELARQTWSPTDFDYWLSLLTPAVMSLLSVSDYVCGCFVCHLKNGTAELHLNPAPPRSNQHFWLVLLCTMMHIIRVSLQFFYIKVLWWFRFFVASFQCFFSQARLTSCACLSSSSGNAPSEPWLCFTSAPDYSVAFGSHKRQQRFLHSLWVNFNSRGFK